MASKLDPEEKLLWASYGSGTRPISDRIYKNVVASLLPTLLAAAILPIISAGTPAAAQIGSLSWMLLLVPVYVGYRSYAGPQFECYAVTDMRAVVLQRDLPFFFRTYEILALRVDEGPPGTGAVRFGGISVAPDRRRYQAGLIDWILNDTTPEAGFYGIAKPHEVARLIQAHVLEPIEGSSAPADATGSELPIES